MLRSHTCGELSKKHIGKKTTLYGWADSIRTHGKIGFINLRDRYGITQVFFSGKLVEKLKDTKRESILKVEGKIKSRPKNQINKKMPTGEIEVDSTNIEIISPAKELPLELNESIESTEETRLKYRYIDLRKPRMQHNIVMRHKIIKAIRDYFNHNDFLEIETPILAKSTPEGARDYLVPSRVNKTNFYALPQSPQIFKQLLMISGFDKYFQIARCMRDEDLRADRQPEFTQLDVEMSFIEEEDIYTLFEGMMKEVWKSVLNKNLKTPFARISYKDSMKKYKSDKPDMRKKGEDFKFVWVTEFPLFEYSKKDKRYVSAHHPFTGINEKDRDLLKKSPEKVRSRSYDLVLNGTELGSGSIRIHENELQKEVFDALKISDKEAKEKFGFFLDALSYGTPIHGGFAIGLDRLVALITNNESIREVIAFPKNKDARDLMLDSPSKVSKKQLDELGLKLK